MSRNVSVRAYRYKKQPVSEFPTHLQLLHAIIWINSMAESTKTFQVAGKVGFCKEREGLQVETCYLNNRSSSGEG